MLPLLLLLLCVVDATVADAAGMPMLSQLLLLPLIAITFFRLLPVLHNMKLMLLLLRVYVLCLC